MRHARLAAVLLISLWPSLSAAQATRSGVVVTALEGNVNARRARAQPVALKFRDSIDANDQIVTGDRGFARLLVRDRAVVTVQERSAVKVTETPGLSTIDVDRGKVGVAVAPDRMPAGERVQIRTPNAILGVRGTVLVVEVGQASAALQPGSVPATTSVFLLRGSLDAQFVTPSGTLTPAVPLNANQKISLTGTTTTPPDPLPMTASDTARVAIGLSPSQLRSTGAAGQNGAQRSAVEQNRQSSSLSRR